MKKTNKLFALLLIVAIILSSFTIKVNATNEYFETKDVAIKSTDTELTVDYIASKEVKFTSFTFRFNYDNTKLEPISEGKDEDGYDTYGKWIDSLDNLMAQGGNKNSVVTITGTGTRSVTIPAGTKIASVRFKPLAGLTDTTSISIVSDINDETFDLTSTCTITKTVDVSSVTLSETAPIDLKIGETKEITATIAPAEATTKTVTWSSADAKIATVTGNGNTCTIKAVAKGTTKIIAQAGDKKAEITVNVVAPITGIKLTDGNGKELTNVPDLHRGSTQLLVVETNPASPSGTPEITAISSNEEIVRISKQADGKYAVTGLKEGEATVEVKVKDATTGQTFTKSCDFKVIIVPLNKLVAPEKVEAELGKEVIIDLTTDPIDATEIPQIMVKSSNESIVKIDEQGRLMAVGIGTATITFAPEGLEPTNVEVTVVEKKIDAPVDENKGEEVGTPEEKKDDKGTPHTGDIAIEIVGILMLVSLAGIIFIVKKNRK